MIFHSVKYSNLRLTVNPKTFSVESGFRVAKGLMNVMRDVFPSGLTIEFKDREFDTRSLGLDKKDESRLINVLIHHPGYGVSFISQNYSKEENPNKDVEKQVKQDKKLAIAKAADTNKNPKSDKK